MTPQPFIAANDPRVSNHARVELMQILEGLCPPPNYKVTLSVDKATEKLQLQVLKRDVSASKFLGITCFRRTQSWDNPECLQRILVARSYEGLLQQLHDTPEFLEFEYAIEGAIETRVAFEV